MVSRDLPLPELTSYSDVTDYYPNV